MNDAAFTDVELQRMLELLDARETKLVSVGHGRSRAAREQASAFVNAWSARGGQIAAVVDWPTDAASWLRAAKRLTATQVDAWVIADDTSGWAPVARRLASDTDWQPARTIGFASTGGDDLPSLAGLDSVDGMHGPTASGELWHVDHGVVIRHRPMNRNNPLPASDRAPIEIVPGAIHVPDWLSVAEQRELVEHCRVWAQGPAPMRAAKLPRGHTMSVKTVCLGWHWAPYRYTRTADDVDGAPVTPMPEWLISRAQNALADAYGTDSEPRYRPDAALINYYDENARLGLHQDKDERSLDPVVSLSIGRSCIFRLGHTEHRGAPHIDGELRSGDLFVFGGPARLAYHGVTKLTAGAADPAVGLENGRLNITLRVTGLTG